MENPSPEAAQVREIRQLLRQVDACLRVRRELRGAQHESVGLSDVYWHPDNLHPALNVVVPRRNTAYVPIGDVQRGLHRLRELGRPARLQYIEGLFPPQYRDQIQSVGLRREVRVPLALRPLTPEHPVPLMAMHEHRVTREVGDMLCVEVGDLHQPIGLARLGLGAEAAYINLLEWRDQTGLEALLHTVMTAANEADTTLLILPDAPVRQSAWGSVLSGMGFIIEGCLITCMDGNDV
ncbi:MAG: hypothetical protein J0M33_08240 [Anaerolineae bacterium]|nr:hypothetical protein [Anaerolineae bacterium]